VSGGARAGRDVRAPARKTFVIDAFPASAFRHLERDAIVCVDVMESATTLVTAVAQGRRALVAASLDEAQALAAGLDHPLVGGEAASPGGGTFEIADSPARLLASTDTARPLVLFSPPGTELITNAAPARAVLVACFRNLTATADHLVRHFRHVALLAAGLREEFSCEDLMGTARIAAVLERRGFEAGDLRSAELVARWGAVDPSLAGWGNGAARLRRLGREDDLELILGRLDDVPLGCLYRNGEVTPAREARAGAGGVRSDRHPALEPPPAQS